MNCFDLITRRNPHANQMCESTVKTEAATDVRAKLMTGDTLEKRKKPNTSVRRT